MAEHERGLHNSDHHEGGCLCGKVRFSVSGPPRSVFYCHCFSCRRQTGGAVASFAAFPVAGHLAWTGEPPAIFHSSPGVTRRFCPHCGTPLSYEAVQFQDEIHLHIGVFDRPDDLVPVAHWHCDERIPWFETADTLPRHPGD